MFYSCTEGSILINNIDICTIKTDRLRQQVGYLAKEPFVVNDSVYYNLQLGNPDITLEEIVEACRVVGLHEDIVNLKEGYDTFLGEGGCRLSSGQKQKLGLARVLLRNASLILLDEVTSDLDGEVEKQICRVIKNISKARIILNVGHRWEIVQRSDRVIVIDDGKIMAEGPPLMLEKECVYYQRLFAGN